VQLTSKTAADDVQDATTKLENNVASAFPMPQIVRDTDRTLNANPGEVSNPVNWCEKMKLRHVAL
jgi:hypothetical protein